MFNWKEFLYKAMILVEYWREREFIINIFCELMLVYRMLVFVNDICCL